MNRLVSSVLYYNTDSEQDSLDSRMVSFISDNYKTAYRLQSQGKKQDREIISPPASGDRLCLRNDRQLCKASVSGNERDYLVARYRHQCPKSASLFRSSSPSSRTDT